VTTAGLRALATLGALALLSACASAPKPTQAPAPAEPVVVQPAPGRKDDAGPKRSPYAPAQEDPSKRGDYVAGGLYAPGVKDSVPDYVPDVDAIPEPEVRAEPRSRYGNRSYAVLGKRYQVLETADGYAEEGMASFYGKKFHGRRTSNQEVYDMYAFTAAHKSLPLPSFVRVTNLDNGKSVVVRVNDRGPFHAGRIIDLSYAAAVKLDFVRRGTARVEVRALTPEEAASPDHDRRLAAAPVPPASAPNALSADEFERWMQERGIRFAGGPSAGGASIGTAPAGGATAAVPAMPADDVPAKVGVDVAAAEVATAASSVATGQAAGGQWLQVAAFSSPDNAERARVRLQEAGIAGAQVLAGEAGGRPVWRLRVGPVAADAMAGLASRLAAVGFESVQPVRD